MDRVIMTKWPLSGRSGRAWAYGFACLGRGWPHLGHRPSP